MKTFMTTAAIIAALTIPALAQQENRGESHGATKATTDAKQGNGPDAKVTPGSAGMTRMAPSTTGAAKMENQGVSGSDKDGGNSTGSTGDTGGTSGGGAGNGGGGGNGSGK